MGEAQGKVVEDACEVVNRRAVGTNDNKIVELAVLKNHPAFHEVIDDRLAVKRRRKTNRIVAAGRAIGKLKVIGKIEPAAFAIVNGLAMLALGLFALRIEFLGSAAARIRFA